MHTIRLAHPGKNALSNDLMGWLEAELDRAGTQPILLTGSGDAFCAGLDLKEIAGFDRPGLERFLRRIDRLCVRLFEHPAPTAAAINGHAIAGGAVLATCCDWRVATPNPRSRIGVNEVALGVCYPPAILRILRNRIPAHQRTRVLLGAHLYPPAEALQVGLVDEIADDVEGLTQRRLGELAGHPRAAYAATKALLRNGIARPDAADEKRFVEQELPQWFSDEVRQRMNAVLKR